MTIPVFLAILPETPPAIVYVDIMGQLGLLHFLILSSIPSLLPLLRVVLFLGALVNIIQVVPYFGMYDDTRCNSENSVMTSMILHLSSVDR